MRYVFLALVMVFLMGCATASPVQVGGVYPGPGVRALNAPEVEQKIAGADVIIVGETHNRASHHEVQLRILKEMLKSGARPLIGVEWLDYTAQPACDDFSQGRLSLAEFAARVDWKNKWGYPLALYSPILKMLKKEKLRLVALNAPRKLIRKVARKGLPSLTKEERKQLAPALNLNDPKYREKVKHQLQPHGIEGQRMADNFYTAQIARDETMAQRLAMALEPWPDSRGKAVVFVGSGHMRLGLGLPPRIARRLPGAKLLTVLPVAAPMLAELSNFAGHRPLADLLVATKANPPRPPRLGLILKKTPQGLEVLGLTPGGPAHAAGLQRGDTLTAIDGVKLKTIKDIHDIIKKSPFKPHTYRFIRQGAAKEASIKISGSK